MRTNKRIALGLLATGLTLGLTNCHTQQTRVRPVDTLELACAADVSQALGIHWTYEDGATEQLDEFGRLMEECLRPSF